MAITNIFKEKVRHPSKTNTWITMRDVVSKDTDILDEHDVKWYDDSLDPITFNYVPVGYSDIEEFHSEEGYDFYNLKLDPIQYEKQNERTNQIILGIEYLDIRYGQYSTTVASGGKILTNINKDLLYYFYCNNDEDRGSYIEVPSDFHFISPKRNSAKTIFLSMYPEDIVIFSRKRDNDSDNVYDYFWGKITSVNNYLYTIETNIEDLEETNDYYLNPEHSILDAQDVFNDSNITFYTAETGDPVSYTITEVESSLGSTPNITISNPYCVYGSSSNSVTQIRLNDWKTVNIPKENRIDRKVWIVSNLTFGQRLNKTAYNTYTIDGLSLGAAWFSDEFYEKVVDPYYKKLLLVGQVSVAEQEYGYIQEEKIRYYDGENNLLSVGSEQAPAYIDAGEFKSINVNLNDLGLLPFGEDNIAESVIIGEEKVISIENINGVNIETLKEIAFTNINNTDSNVLRIIEEEGENNG